MALLNLSAILADAAAAPGGAQPDPKGQLVGMAVPLMLMLVMGYFVLIRPNQKRAKDQANMIKAMRPGDKIVTTGGILGVVVTVKEKSISIRSADSKMEITKTAVAEVVERAGEAAASASAS
jgi:preprotein translocase subunit YajC